jgi:phosphotransferase system enzyme I (PtsI)
MKTYKGIGASSGISGVAKTFLIKEENFEIKKINIEDTKLEFEKYTNSINEATKQITELKENTEKKLGAEEAAIFDAHLQILNDPEFGTQIKAKIESEKVNSS